MQTPPATAVDIPVSLRALGLSGAELAYCARVVLCAEIQERVMRNVLLSDLALIGVLWIADVSDDATSGAVFQGMAAAATSLASITLPTFLLLCVAVYGWMGRRVRRMVEDAPLRPEARQLLRTTVAAMARHVWMRLIPRRWRRVR